MGVPPSAIASRIAITRPRIAGSVPSCSRLLVELANVSADTPISISAAPNSQYVGISAASVQPDAEQRRRRQQDLDARLLRRAASSAPEIVPIAMMDISRP